MLAVTIGLGEKWAALAELAAESVRRRTGLETAILNETALQRHNLAKPHYLKFHLFEEFPEADCILYFDADTLFLQEWEPRAYFNKQEIVCVQDFWDRDYIRDDARDIGIAPKDYFNTGFFIINRDHHQPLLKQAKAMVGKFRERFYDQTAINAARAELKIPLLFLPSEYNWLGFDEFGCEPSAEALRVVIGHCVNTDCKPVEQIKAYFRFWIEQGFGRRAETLPRETEFDRLKLTPNEAHHRALLEHTVAIEHVYPENRFQGRGIVICGGGAKYFPCIWVCLNMLRRLGCQLPVEIWHLGPEEMNEPMRALVEPLGAVCVDALQVREKHPSRILNGWEVKAYSLIHCRFEEVLLLDADNVPVRDPSYLFDEPAYLQHGAVLWPDEGRLASDHKVWRIFGLEYRDELEVESGQILLNKAKCWKSIQVTMHLNEYSDFYYRCFYGDKETFHLGWRKAGQPYAMTSTRMRRMAGVVICQFDFQGQLLFQHRNGDKWRLGGSNRRVPGFLFEEECFQLLEELMEKWANMGIGFTPYSETTKSELEKATALRLLACEYEYERVGHDRRTMSFLPDGRVGKGSAGSELFWDIKTQENELSLEIYSGSNLTMRLKEDVHGLWHGRWEHYERMPIVLRPKQSKNSR